MSDIEIEGSLNIPAPIDSGEIDDNSNSDDTDESDSDSGSNDSLENVLKEPYQLQNGLSPKSQDFILEGPYEF